MPTIDIIIVNWNSGVQLQQCLTSIAESDSRSYEIRRIIVVDNGSEDASLSTAPPSSLPLTIVHNSANRGFAMASNQGAQLSTSDFMLFLNPDTRLFPDSLERVVRFMAEPGRSQVGICGVALEDLSGKVHRSCCRFPTPLDFVIEATGIEILLPRLIQGHRMLEWPHDNTCRVDHVMGAFFFVRKTVFQELLGFDDRFFVYMEDVDFSYRAAKAGWESWFLSSSRVFHKGGGTSDQIKARRLFYSRRSRLQYAQKHFRVSGKAAAMVAMVTVEPLMRLLRACTHASFSEIRDTICAYWHFVATIVSRP